MTSYRMPGERIVDPNEDTAAISEEDDLRELSDELLGDVSIASLPTLYELHQMSRRNRANMVRRVQALLPQVVKVNSKSVDAADALDFLADIEDVLAEAAVDRDALKAWAQDADDTLLFGLFARWAMALTSGEANSSSS